MKFTYFLKSGEKGSNGIGGNDEGLKTFEHIIWQRERDWLDKEARYVAMSEWLVVGEEKGHKKQEEEER